jgi:hypothetical protein
MYKHSILLLSEGIRVACKMNGICAFSSDFFSSSSSNLLTNRNINSKQHVKLDQSITRLVILFITTCSGHFLSLSIEQNSMCADVI